MKSTEERERTAKGGHSGELFRTWRYFFVLLVLAILVVLFYGEENWRGRRDLENYKRELQARGQTVEASAFVPALVPDAENFAMTPLLAPLFDFQPGTQKSRDTNAVQRAQGFAPVYDAARRWVKDEKQVRSNSWLKARLNLVAWERGFLEARSQDRSKSRSRPDEGTSASKSIVPAAAKDGKESDRAMITPQEAARGILAELSEYDSEIEQIRADSGRPSSRFNLRYAEEDPAGILLPHLGVLKRLTEILQLRASAELALDRNEEAFKDVQLMFALGDAVRQEPILISQLVRLSQIRIALEVIAQGMQHWSDPQLQELQVRLVQFNYCADIKRALEAERALFGGGVIDYLRRSPRQYNALSSNENELLGVLLSVVPGGWFDFEKLNYYRLFEDYLGPAAELPNINPRSVQQAEQRVNNVLAKPPAVLFLEHRFFARLLTPNLAGMYRKAAFGQEGVEAASIACALERYRRVHGAFPEKLEALTPQFAERIPQDIILGQPLHYQRMEPGQYLLYSVGWNEKDDGGKVMPEKANRGEAADEGDWVWRPN